MKIPREPKPVKDATFWSGSTHRYLQVVSSVMPTVVSTRYVNLRHSSRILALKVLRTEQFNEKRRDSFFDEAQRIAHLTPQHPSSL